jgi:hypothetical protein
MEEEMSGTHFAYTRSQGWARLGLPCAVAAAASAPLLWSLGAFDSAIDPLLSATVYGLASVIICGLVPALLGWALQGFVVRRKSADESEHAESASPRGPTLAPPPRSGRG